MDDIDLTLKIVTSRDLAPPSRAPEVQYERLEF